MPAIPSSSCQVPKHSSLDPAYGPDDIQSTTIWYDLNLETVLQRYNHVLTQATIRTDPMPLSPSMPVPSGDSLRWGLWENVFLRIRRSLRAGFNYLAEAGEESMDGISSVVFDNGDVAQTSYGYRRVMAYYEAALDSGTGPNRGPGDARISWEWNTGWPPIQIPKCAINTTKG